MAETAQYMISMELFPFPKFFEARLVEEGFVSQVVSCLMSEEIYDVPRAVAFVADNEKALKILIETDLNILAKLIQGSDKVL